MRVRGFIKLGVAAGAAGALLLGAVPAGAVTVSSQAGVLSIVDSQGEQNVIFVQPPPDSTLATSEVIVRSGDETLTGGAGCTEAPPEQAAYKREFHCARGERMTLDVRLGGGQDEYFGYPGVPYDSAVIDGGSDGDRLETPSGSPDEFIGGDGLDVVGYGFTTQIGVTASLDGQANDGALGEGDYIHPDVESLGGGFGDDHLYGNDARNIINGGSGDDVIVGAGGNDTLSADEGKDRIDGGPGEDALDGAEWPHYQSPDTLDCGADFDFVRLDEYDTHAGCENGSYPMGPGTAWWSPAQPGHYPAWLPPMPAPAPVIATSGTVDPKMTGAHVSAKCRKAASTPCRGRLKLVPVKHPGKRKFGSTAFSIAPGKAKKLRVRLGSYGRRAAKGRQKLRAAAVVTPANGGAAKRTVVVLRVAG